MSPRQHRRHRLGGHRLALALLPAAALAAAPGAGGPPAIPLPPDRSPDGRPHRHARAGLAVRSPRREAKTVRVIVGLQTRFTPEGALDDDRASRTQRPRSTACASGSSARSPARSTASSTRSRPIPSVALELSPEALGALERLRPGRQHRRGRAVGAARSPRARSSSSRPRPTRSAATAPASTSRSSTPASTSAHSVPGRQGRLRGVLLGRRLPRRREQLDRRRLRPAVHVRPGRLPARDARGRHRRGQRHLVQRRRPGREPDRDQRVLALHGQRLRRRGRARAHAASRSDQIKGLERVMALRSTLRIAP